MTDIYECVRCGALRAFEEPELGKCHNCDRRHKAEEWRRVGALCG